MEEGPCNSQNKAAETRPQNNTLQPQMQNRASNNKCNIITEKQNDLIYITKACGMIKCNISL